MARRLRNTEQGFTLIESLVALLIVSIGVMAVLTMIERSALATGNNRVREGATNLAREVLERARQLNYTTFHDPGATAALGANIPGATVSGSAYQVTRRSVVYTFTATACEVDDPSDGYGPETSIFCSPQGTGSTTSIPLDPTAIQAAAVTVNLAGIAVPIVSGGSLVNSVCATLGSNASLQAALSASSAARKLTAAAGADVRGCSGGSLGYALDTQPDDYKRVSVTASWPAGTGSARPAGSVTEQILVPAPGGGATS